MITMGVPGLAAHMFVFYFGVFSFITPPVCTAVLTASSVGQASFMGTAKHACKLAIPGFIVPFLFIFNPPVALMGTSWEIFREVAFSVVAVVAICFCLEGYFREKLNAVFRILFLAVSAGLFLPFPPLVSIIVSACFVVLVVLAFLDGGRKRRLSAA
jgi:TRAP-type uncharacterized transport system fused permease subunit